MKLFMIAAVLGVCAAGRLDNTYLPPNQGGGGGFGTGGHGGFGAGGNAGGFGAGGHGGFGAGGNAGGFGAGGHGGFGAGGNAGGFGAGGHGGGFGGTQHSGNAYNAGAYQGGFGGGSGGSSRPYDANAQILRLANENHVDQFNYNFETSNGIRAEASGVATNGVQEHGSFGYKGDDGQDYSITYTADENGYRPQGAHLPTPPPIPEAILKSLEQNAREEAAGIHDDGNYHGEGAGGYSGPSNAYGAPSQAYQAPRGPGSFGGAASRQYLAPHAGGRGGSGNFNSQSGYHY